MFIIFDKRTGAILYTIENQVEEIRLEETQGLVESNEKIGILDYYVNLFDLQLTKKIYVSIEQYESKLLINSDDKELKEVELRIEKQDGLKSTKVPLTDGKAEIPLIIETAEIVRFSVFDYKTKSNILEVNNSKEEIDINKGIVI